MKKLLLVTILSSIIFLKCSKEETKPQELLVSTINISFYSGDTLRINAISDFNIVYNSDNEFHATVSSSGLVTGIKVGETIINITSNGISKEISVEVLPRQELFPGLILDWGKLRSSIISEQGDPDESTIDDILYFKFGEAEWISYDFDDNDKLIATWVYLKSASSSLVIEFLKERYAFIDKQNGVDFFSDSYSADDATLFIAIGEDSFDPNFLLLSYEPY